MEKDFLITKINQVILVSKEKYTESKLSFCSELHYNELIFHYSGDAIVYFDDNVLETKENTLRFLPAGKVSRYDVQRNVYGECIDVFFDTDKPISKSAFVIDASKKEHIGTLFKRLFSSWSGKTEGYYFECMSILYKIFAEIQKTTYLPPEQYLKIKPAIDEINNEFLNKSLTSEYLSSLCEVSESYFKKLFKRRFGVPPKKYIIQKKLNYSCDLLLLGLYTVTQVAELCGFSDVYFFSRLFKKQFGLSPSEYVKKHKD